jgi:hypothetical protein
VPRPGRAAGRGGQLLPDPGLLVLILVPGLRLGVQGRLRALGVPLLPPGAPAATQPAPGAAEEFAAPGQGHAEEAAGRLQHGAGAGLLAARHPDAAPAPPVPEAGVPAPAPPPTTPIARVTPSSSQV